MSNLLKPPTVDYLEWKNRVIEGPDIGGQIQWAINMTKSLISTLQNYENAKGWMEKLKYIGSAIMAVAALTACIATVKSIISDKMGGPKDSKGGKNSKIKIDDGASIE